MKALMQTSVQEGGYDFMRLNNAELCMLRDGETLREAQTRTMSAGGLYSYMCGLGCLSVDGAPMALAAIPAVVCFWCRQVPLFLLPSLVCTRALLRVQDLAVDHSVQFVF